MRLARHLQLIAEARAAFANDLKMVRQEQQQEVARLRNVYEQQVSNLTEQLDTANATIKTLIERMQERYLPIPVPFQDGVGKKGHLVIDPLGTGLLTEVQFDEDDPYNDTDE